MPISTVKLRELFESYKQWVVQNPTTVSEIEQVAKWTSYLIAARFTTSSISTELIYSLSNLLVLFNDRIIEKSYGITPVVIEKSAHRLKVVLTTLEYCEVLLENCAFKLYGVKGKWSLIVVLQTIKALGRLLLLRQYSDNIICSPPIQILNRRKLISSSEAVELKDAQKLASTVAFKLKRSNRVIRKVEGAPPIQYRLWKPLENPCHNETKRKTLLQAEILYIAKPLVHLLSMGVFGRRSWTSYSIAFVIDFLSIRSYYKNRQLLSKQQRVEMARRCVAFLLYFVRSPFYEKYSERKIKSTIQAVGRKIPLTKSLCEPIIEYLPQWQGTYFYMWST